MPRGVCVKGLGKRRGHRAKAASEIAKQGGKRVKAAAPAEAEWVHPDTQAALYSSTARSVARHAPGAAIA